MTCMLWAWQEGWEDAPFNPNIGQDEAALEAGSASG